MGWFTSSSHEAYFLQGFVAGPGKNQVNVFLIERQEGSEYLSAVLRHIVQVGRVTESQRFFRLLEENVSKKLGGDMMSLAQVWKKQGHAIGIVQGKREGKLLVAKNLLAMGLSLEQIAKATCLSIGQIQALKEEEETIKA